VRAVLDPNVPISALLSTGGAPARVVGEWFSGRFELIVSPRLLAEVERALGYPKLRARISEQDAHDVVQLLRRSATTARDPEDPLAQRSADPGDDYLLALAASERAALVSGDKHLLALEHELPVFSPSSFLVLLERGP